MLPRYQSNLTEYPLIRSLIENGTLIRKDEEIIYSQQPDCGPLFSIGEEGRLSFNLNGEHIDYLPLAEQARGDLLQRRATPDDFAIIGQSHRYDHVVAGHSWLNIYIPGGMNKELHQTKKHASILAGTRANMAETIAMCTPIAIVENAVQEKGKSDFTGLDVALLMPVTRQCAATLAMNGFLQAIAQGDSKLHRLYRAIPFGGRNCSRGSEDDLKAIGVDLDAIIGTHRFSYSPAQFGSRIRDLAPDSAGPMLTVQLQGKEGSLNVDSATAENGLPVMVVRDAGMCKGSYLYLDNAWKVELSTDFLLYEAADVLKKQWFQRGPTREMTLAPTLEGMEGLKVHEVETLEKHAFKLPLGVGRLFDSFPMQCGQEKSLLRD